MENIAIFSDGGPAHFKSNASISVLSQLAQQFNFNFTYDFFAPHHGRSVCDTVAAIVKSKLLECALQQHFFRHTTEVHPTHHISLTERTLQVVDAINKIPNAYMELIDIDCHKSVDTPKIHSISKLFHWAFGAAGQVQAWYHTKYHRPFFSNMIGHHIMPLASHDRMLTG